MVDATPGCGWGWLRPSRTVASRAAQAGGLGKREAAEPAPRLSHQPGVHRCGINHLTARPAVVGWYLHVLQVVRGDLCEGRRRDDAAPDRVPRLVDDDH